jgi:hypothetical protein
MQRANHNTNAQDCVHAVADTPLLLPAAIHHFHFIHTYSDGLNASHCQVSWGDFCVDPWGNSDRVHDKGCLMRSKSYMYFHMMDQFHCMVTAEGNWAVDYIGRVESANDDWKDVSSWVAGGVVTGGVASMC